jgi:hypothetical protein
MRRARPRWGVALLPMVAILVASCHGLPVAQQRICAGVSEEQCSAVITAMSFSVPDTTRSRLAVVGYAELQAPIPTPRPTSAGNLTFLVAYAPWDDRAQTGAYRSPPLWRLTSKAEGMWSVEPLDVTQSTSASSRPWVVLG